ncbi:hypothetical protein BST92_05510 [Nonlabens arenilitoris]|uniref:DUF6705 domain-containing protein n=1 Tax=Nonlabens arenilitoris TaxID=1217969 RepID=A0A2S7U9W0_9FLAO|nr:hypothetical protein [Nonlabens arenilitoris]PQJ31410.1 hypothetical protein BST92_05510 [Nonlabens arenilitoris]
MKIKIISILILILTIYTNPLKAQDVIMSLDTFTIYADDDGSSIPDDITYIKDVNNRLDPFVGTFTGIYAGKIYTFVISKYKDPSDGVAIDVLNIKYKIEDSNGVSLAQTLNIPDKSYDITGQRFTSEGFYTATYVGFDGCAQAGTFSMVLSDTTNLPTITPNQLTVYLDPARELLTNDECPNGASPHIFPTNEHFVLTRI